MRMIEDASATMKSLQSVAARLDGMAEPMPGQLKELGDQISATLASIQATSDRLRDAASDNSETMSSLNDALRELTAAARAAKELTGFLERNPGAILGGRRTPSTDSK
jgi:ABC-type transporter Mla subunit MlaD